jgi:regulator of replication initiation timing
LLGAVYERKTHWLLKNTLANLITTNKTLTYENACYKKYLPNKAIDKKGIRILENLTKPKENSTNEADKIL